MTPQRGRGYLFNPVNGGRNNDNVTDYRYALVECDNLELEKQQAIIRQLELPCAALVYSGGKSLHAIVRVNAPDYAEYRKRVDYLYTVCQKNGLTLDQANRNPSRLSRMPGVVRGGPKAIPAGHEPGQKLLGRVARLGGGQHRRFTGHREPGRRLGRPSAAGGFPHRRRAARRGIKMLLARPEQGRQELCPD